MLFFGDINEERAATKSVTKTVAFTLGSGSDSGVTQDACDSSGSSSLATTKSTKVTKASPTKKKQAVLSPSGSSGEAQWRFEWIGGPACGIERRCQWVGLPLSDSDSDDLFDMSGSGFDSLSGSELDTLLSSLGSSDLGDWRVGRRVAFFGRE
ncbi:hypothetical protein PI124_g13970 [Phytophthora idaei]|nr:hypothetical protein PI125_g19210 [Phytophthora idaei]KAG3141652.1 hypothetical protein PI126_g15396 [Phytophthora idaei]KAG3241158.1 hypothetical protein PI124_g13970 [Phytophthora idaei]